MSRSPTPDPLEGGGQPVARDAPMSGASAPDPPGGGGQPVARDAPMSGSSARDRPGGAARPVARDAPISGASAPDRPGGAARPVARGARTSGASAPVVPPPGRQGPGPLPGALVEALDLVLARRAAGVFPGERRAAGLGDGTELAQVRPYRIGDDVRRLDPAASARTGVPHVRDLVPERTLTVWILLDVSASMAFGTGARLKSDVAEGVVEVVGRLAVRRAGRVALLTCGAPVTRLLPPRSGRRALVTLRRAVAQGVAPDGTAPPADALAAALRRLGRVARGPGLVVVISDFREDAGPPQPLNAQPPHPLNAAPDAQPPHPLNAAPDAQPPHPLNAAGEATPDWARALRALGARHDVLAVEVVDPREGELPPAGQLVLVDPETGRRLEADTTSAELQRRFAAAELARRDAVSAALRRAGARHVELGTDGDWLRELGRGLR